MTLTIFWATSSVIALLYVVFFCNYRDWYLLLCLLKRGNFRYTESSVGVESQLNNLASVTQVIDPKLHQHLGKSVYLII